MAKLILSHKYNYRPEKIFNLIQNGTLFRLTGADKIMFDFKEDEFFSLIFNGRGSIYGEILQIIPDEFVSLLWNVNGFGRNDEIDTMVNISIDKVNNEGTNITIEHTGIKNEESFTAKQNAWKEILEKLEMEISS